MVDNATPEIMTIGQAARYLQLSIETVRRAARDETLPAAKIGGGWRIRKIDLDDFISAGGNRRRVKQQRLAV